MSDNPPRSEKVYSVAQSAPVALSVKQIDAFLSYAGAARTEDQERVRDAIHAANDDRAVLEGLFERFERNRRNDFGAALLALAVIGELRNPEALFRLDRLVWEEAPEEDAPGHGALGSVDILEMLQAKAVEGIAYVGNEDADELVLRIIRRHPSFAVRSAAADAYLFNHGDSQEARGLLRKALEPDDTSFADRARLTSSADREVFNSDLSRYYRLHPEDVAPEPGRPDRRPERDKREPPTRSDR